MGRVYRFAIHHGNTATDRSFQTVSSQCTVQQELNVFPWFFSKTNFYSVTVTQL